MHHGEKQALISSRHFYNRQTMVDRKFTQSTNVVLSQETFQFRDVRGMCYILGLCAIHPAELNPTFLRAPSRFLERIGFPWCTPSRPWASLQYPCVPWYWLYITIILGRRPSDTSGSLWALRIVLDGFMHAVSDGPFSLRDFSSTGTGECFLSRRCTARVPRFQCDLQFRSYFCWKLRVDSCGKSWYLDRKNLKIDILLQEK